MHHKKERWVHWLLRAITCCCGLILFYVFFTLLHESLPFFREVNPMDFCLTTVWKPLGHSPTFGILPILLGTLVVSLLGVMIALPFAVGCSFFLVFCLPSKYAKILLSWIDMLSGIPSVIFGFMGLVLLVKAIETYLPVTSGESVLAGALLLSIMLLPYLITGYVETLEEGKKTYYTSSLALGVSKWYTMLVLILPFSAKSLFAMVLLALSRAMGETMAVMMVIGNAPIFPKLLGRCQTLPSLIALEMGSAAYQSMHYSALYGASVILLILLVSIQWLAKRLLKKGLL
ncbi:MAG: phosphate ABC transporter permease subunit PstC [Cellulosilyticaceae bacterium]